MLAYNGLALITEKLQNQRLEEPPLPASCCGKLPQVTQENSPKPDRSLQQQQQQQHTLAVKGKNVWTLPVEASERGGGGIGFGAAHHEFMQPAARSVGLRPLSDREQSFSSPSSFSSSPSSSSSVCRHRKFRYTCQICDNSPGVPSAPPKKKHCRSLSVPPDGPSTVLPSPRRDSIGPKLLRPIAVLPLTSTPTNNNVSQDKDRNLRVRDGSSFLSSSSSSSMGLPKLTSTMGYNNSNVNNNNNISSSNNISSGSSSSNSFRLVPSSPSVDSGHFTTSDLQTPPRSPVPRPASAAASDASYNSLGSAWHDFAPMRTRVRVLENRSLSMEDHAVTSSMPCVHGDGAGAGMDSPLSSCSTSTRCRSSSGINRGDECSGGGRGCSSTIPRCHSQPCVLHHRRCGQKRRRDYCDRPTLNFNKMTETAYVCSYRGIVRSDPWNTPVVNDRQNRQGLQYNFLDSAGGAKNPFFLNPIASSPLDSELPAISLQDNKYERELNHAASVALPLTPPDPSSSLELSRHFGGGKEERDDSEIEDDDDGEDSEDGDCRCHDNRQDSSVDLFPMNDLDLEQIENC